MTNDPNAREHFEPLSPPSAEQPADPTPEPDLAQPAAPQAAAEQPAAKPTAVQEPPRRRRFSFRRRPKDESESEAGAASAPASVEAGSAPAPSQAGSAEVPAPSRPPRRIEVLYFGPSNALRTPLAEYSHAYAANFASGLDIVVRPVLNQKTVEVLDGYEDGIRWVKMVVTRALRNQSLVRDQVLQADLGRVTKREFWGAYYAARLRPESPLCLVFHDPPNLPDPVLPHQTERKPGIIDKILFVSFFERMLRRSLADFTNRLALYARRRVEHEFLERASVFLSLTERGAEALSIQYPEYRHKIARLPMWCLDQAPLSLEPNERAGEKDRIVFGMFAYDGSPQGIETVVEGLLLAHQRAPLLAKAVLRVRGHMTERSINEDLLKRLTDRVRSAGARQILDIRPGVMSAEETDAFFRDVDVMLFPYDEGECEGANVPFMRCQGWAVAVIASDTGTFREAIMDGEDGFLVQPNNVPAMADRIARLVADPTRRINLAKKLTEQARNERSVDKLSNCLRRIYAEMLVASREGRPVNLPEDLRSE